MKKITITLLFITLITPIFSSAQEIATLKYNGGGDWYSNPTALPNLISYCNTNLNTTIKEKPQVVEVGSSSIFQYPFIHMTGHGNVFFSKSDAQNLQDYLISGGFLHIDDNYGMEPYLRKELVKIFPDKELKEIGKNHEIFKDKFIFKEGLPKIHEHNSKRPQAFGFFHEGRLVLLFTYESDLGDGWEDPSVHNDPKEIRKKALKMGANIINYAFKH
ncbi:DUF4159 domain-containing protein [uncultured Maribacter sp.]|uniref:DUF4159 domain-containing protein n=1 Tax=uncultured Maribacter sp. TaxID=431308 RepID=UPI0026257C4B|nr:DUF4159 domain-containing protein [uncultured Maribacter sp.]